MQWQSGPSADEQAGTRYCSVASGNNCAVVDRFGVGGRRCRLILRLDGLSPRTFERSAPARDRQRCRGRASSVGSATRRRLAEKLIDRRHSSLRSGRFRIRSPAEVRRLNNARMIFAYDVCHALTELGLSEGLHFESDYQSLAVELYSRCRSYLGENPQGNPLNPRSTFERMKNANIRLK